MIYTFFKQKRNAIRQQKRNANREAICITYRQLLPGRHVSWDRQFSSGSYFGFELGRFYADRPTNPEVRLNTMKIKSKWLKESLSWGLVLFASIAAITHARAQTPRPSPPPAHRRENDQERLGAARLLRPLGRRLLTRTTVN